MIDHPLTTQTLANRYTSRSFATLDKHATRGPIDTIAALRLLRRNVRDVAPQASHETQQHIAQQLLTHWRNARMTAGQQME